MEYLVDAVVHSVIHPVIQLVDLLTQVLRVERQALDVLRDQVIERGVEHTDDLRALIVH